MAYETVAPAGTFALSVTVKVAVPSLSFTTTSSMEIPATSSLSIFTVALLGAPTVYPVPLAKVTITVSNPTSTSESFIGVKVMEALSCPSPMETVPERAI